MEGQQTMHNILIIWRGKRLNVEINSDATLKEFGIKLQKLSKVKADTIRLLVPLYSDKGSRMLSPFSDEHSSLCLKDTFILESKSIRMMGVFEKEIDEVILNAKTDLRIAGFDEEKRMRQHMSKRPQSSLSLPQGPYIFCDFRTLHIPGIELKPPASEALKRMHMLAADPGIVAIMNKHRWRVGIMTEMAPVGYVGVSPKCFLGYNKNHGEEISLRIRTDDLKGFRKYESIKKTLLHELAHMVYSEHDAHFYALDKQLNQEADSLDWTKSRGRTLSGTRHSVDYEEESYIGTSGSKPQKLGGDASDQLASARSASVAAAYRRLASTSNVDAEPDPDDSEFEVIGEPDPFDSVRKEDLHIENSQESEQNFDYEPDPDDCLDATSKYEPDPDDSMESGPYSAISENKIKFEPDPDDSEMTRVPHLIINEKLVSLRTSEEADCNDSDVALKYVVMAKPENKDSQKIENVVSENQPKKVHKEPDPDDSIVKQVIWDSRNGAEPDQSISQEIEATDEVMKISNSGEPDPDDNKLGLLNKDEMHSEPNPVNSPFNRNLQAEPDPDDNNACFLGSSGMQANEPDPDDQELQRIQDPVTVYCTRLQNAIEMLQSEANRTEATSVLQTLFKIIRNVIEHPDEIKFKRLRKDNQLFQRNIAKYKAAMEVLFLVGFTEDIVYDGIGRAETYLVLKRNDPGLLWLAKSSLEMRTV